MRFKKALVLLFVLMFVAGWTAFAQTPGEKVGDTKLDVLVYYSGTPNYIWAGTGGAVVAYAVGTPDTITGTETDFKVVVKNVESGESVTLSLPDDDENAKFGIGTPAVTKMSDGRTVVMTITGGIPWGYIGGWAKGGYLFMENSAGSGDYSPIWLIDFASRYDLILQPYIDVDENGIIHLAAYDGWGYGINYMNSEDDGFTFGNAIMWEAGNLIVPTEREEANNNILGAGMAVSSTGRVALYQQDECGDVAVQESEDGGISWLDPFLLMNNPPVPEDGDPDHVRPNRNADAVYDANDNLHVVFEGTYFLIGTDENIKARSTRFGKGALGDNYVNFIPHPADYKDRIMHWSEATGVTTAAVSVAPSVDLDRRYLSFAGSSWFTMVNFPSVAVDKSTGALYVAYTQFNENDASKSQMAWAEGDTTDFYYGYGDIYFVASTDGGATWSTPVNLTNTKGFDERYPKMYKEVVDGKIHMAYYGDNEAGMQWGFPDDAENWDCGVYYYAFDPAKYTDVNENRHNNNIKSFALYNNYPNPFNLTTAIKYSIKKSADVKLEIYNLMGQKVKTLVNNYVAAGTHTVRWDGRDDNGNVVASGVYFYKLTADGKTAAKKLTLLK